MIEFKDLQIEENFEQAQYRDNWFCCKLKEGI
jgi:hypothetical protein